MHDTEFIVVFLVCITLALGAIARMFAGRIRVPYTILMLLLGLAAGLLLKKLGDAGGSKVLTETFARGANVTPHLIIFVFLPALVFESAFALDVHAFRKNLGAVSLLAVPALLLATAATGYIMVQITGGGWGWSLELALVFGALISATDPVAVVAILRETGAPKRLGVLIEGESLLNDGTAIVVFNSLMIVLTAGGWANIDIAERSLSFVWVVSGGVAVGFGLAALVGFLLGRSFNEPLIEITLTITLAYAAMIVAEGLLHVSGVLAVVTAGLYMGGPGRTRISPEVHHFLHQFWEMLAYIANTLIFFLVGLVIAVQLEQAKLGDVGIVLAAYAAIMVLRAVLTFGFKPFIGMVSDPISKAQATVMSWGGLRGAVSLALALVVAQNQDIPPDLRRQLLFATAGVVFLTILVNGGTTGWLLARMGFTRKSLGDQVAELSARAGVLAGVQAKVEDVSQSRDLKMVPWNEVNDDLTRRHAELQDQLARAHAELEKTRGAERAVGYWRQAISLERQAYWSAFAHGTLSATAALMLEKELDVHLDRLGAGDTEIGPTRLPAKIQGLPKRVLRSAGLEPARFQFSRLSLLYELSRAENRAAASVLSHLDDLQGIDPGTEELIARAYQSFLRQAKERIEDIRSNLPEVARAIETQLARRIQLNFERDAYEHLAHHGGMEEGAIKGALDEVEKQMKLLRGGARRVPLPETADICRELPMFASMDEAALENLAEITEEKVLSPGEALFHQGDKGDSMFIVVRGAVHVIKEDGDREIILDVLGGGDILGEMSLLTGEPRSATIKAATTVTVGRVRRDAFEKMIAAHPDVRAGVWGAFTRNRFDNLLRRDDKFKHLDRDERMAWLAAGSEAELGDGEPVDCTDAAYVFLVLGTLEVWKSERTAPCLLPVTRGVTMTCRGEARVVVLPTYGIGAGADAGGDAQAE